MDSYTGGEITRMASAVSALVPSQDAGARASSSATKRARQSTGGIDLRPYGGYQPKSNLLYIFSPSAAAQAGGRCCGALGLQLSRSSRGPRV